MQGVVLASRLSTSHFWAHACYVVVTKTGPRATGAREA